MQKSPCWLGNSNDHLAVTDLILNLLSVFVYAWYYGHHGEHRAGGRARVTMVTRRRAGAERFVLLEIQKSPCWLGDSNGHLAVTDWISKVISVFVYAWYCGHHREHRAGGRARVTRVTRRRAGVERCVLPEMQESPCWPRNSNDRLETTDLISKLTSVLSYV